MSVYTARCKREGNWWVVTVPELGRTTQARRLDQVRAMVLDLVQLFTEDEPDEVEVRLSVALPDDLGQAIEHAEELRSRAAQMQAEASKTWVTTAQELHRRGFTVRDVGSVLGVSFQRAQQLIKS